MRISSASCVILNGLLCVGTAWALPAAAADPCVLTSYDANAVKKAKSHCKILTLQGFETPAKTTLDLTKLQDGATVYFRGTFTWAYAEWKGPLMKIDGANVHVDGRDALFDGQGTRWWDGKGGNGGKDKPKFIKIKTSGSSLVENLNVLNPPVQTFSLDGSVGLTIQGINIDSSAGDANQLGHNTDGFDIGQVDRLVLRDSRVRNQDDCVAINSGNQITISGMVCDGGHGISIGSVRSDTTVSNVYISRSTISNSDTAVRVKTIAGATNAFVSDITYEDIRLENIGRYGIDVQQDYLNGGPTGNPSNGVKVSGLRFTRIAGNMKPSKKTSKSIYILCGQGSCTNWTWTDINIQGSSPSCVNQPAGINC